jgi:hypothetical protein
LIELARWIFDGKINPRGEGVVQRPFGGAAGIGACHLRKGIDVVESEI